MERKKQTHKYPILEKRDGVWKGPTIFSQYTSRKKKKKYGGEGEKGKVNQTWPLFPGKIELQRRGKIVKKFWSTEGFVRQGGNYQKKRKCQF